ncbi:hypothetical protein QBC33DRAFT_382227 [Phialemonium atrogriseum]|uniref:Uncharacterized protein n=1 Tax=Phialemonium atrogriseum TaxID=1093897 RepID=A0AAJ0C4I2_9PEZI|nr:uncharacterized protein QBC33DRAFT_382227 [Phialemonium atrogriseum]KAK1768547.1 hypothetical protein QBC33DRAFT_382227 [Phialemonium atrogriseum]
MCQYILPLPLCNHPPATIWALPGDESCPLLLAQLRRTYDPAEWEGAARASALPFDLPDRCGPCRDNIVVIRVARLCAGCRRGGGGGCRGVGAELI